MIVAPMKLLSLSVDIEKSARVRSQPEKSTRGAMTEAKAPSTAFAVWKEARMRCAASHAARVGVSPEKAAQQLSAQAEVDLREKRPLRYVFDLILPTAADDASAGEGPSGDGSRSAGASRG